MLENTLLCWKIQSYPNDYYANTEVCHSCFKVLAHQRILAAIIKSWRNLDVHQLHCLKEKLFLFSFLLTCTLPVRSYKGSLRNTKKVKTKFTAVTSVCDIVMPTQNTQPPPFPSGVPLYARFWGEVPLSWAIKLPSVPCNVNHGNVLPMMIVMEIG